MSPTPGIEYDTDGALDGTDVHTFFELTYASYLVRSGAAVIAQAPEVQSRFFRCVAELARAFSHIELPHHYAALPVDSNRMYDLRQQELRGWDSSDLDDNEEPSDASEPYLTEDDCLTEDVMAPMEAQSLQTLSELAKRDAEAALASPFFDGRRFVLPRTLLQSMPELWQFGFTATMQDLDRSVRATDTLTDADDFIVRSRGADDTDTFDPVPPYNRGRTHVAPSAGWSRVQPAPTERSSPQGPFLF